MKLSEMNTTQFADALCDLVEPVTAIMGDEKIIETLKENALKQQEGNASPLEIRAALIKGAIPILLKTHREDVIAILSTLTGKTRKAIAAQPGIQTIKDIRECWDNDLRDFFVSALV